MLLNYKSFGEGEPLLILHGFLGSLDNWQSIAKTLSAQFNVITLDVRNHGKSFHLPIHDYSAMMEDIVFLLDHLRFEKVHIIGHSMGGKLAMLFALAHKERVNKLIIVDIAPKVYKPGHEDILHALSSLDLTNLKTRQEASDQLSEYLNDPGVVLFLLKNLERSVDGHFNWKMNFPVLSSQYENILSFSGQGHFDNPTLFLRGSESDYILDEDLPTIQSYFPKSDCVTISHAGHWLHAENPKDFIAEAFHFLNK